MQPIKVWIDQETYVRLVNSAFDEEHTIPEQAAELIKRALDAVPAPMNAATPRDDRALARMEA